MRKLKRALIVVLIYLLFDSNKNEFKIEKQIIYNISKMQNDGNNSGNNNNNGTDAYSTGNGNNLLRRESLVGGMVSCIEYRIVVILLKEALLIFRGTEAYHTLLLFLASHYFCFVFVWVVGEHIRRGDVWSKPSI